MCIRDRGIDAPEMKQKCKKEKLKISSIIGYTFYEDYYCGEHSKENLEAKVKGSNIKCISFTKDRYKRYLAKCFKGEINLNWRLIFSPDEVVRYIIVHEVCHLIEFNHSDKFWKLIKKHCPNYTSQINWLKKNDNYLYSIRFS